MDLDYTRALTPARRLAPRRQPHIVVKCGIILLLFDPDKLYIGDEFKHVISSLRGHGDKIRVVLNKADQVDTQQVEFCYSHFMVPLIHCFVY
jgi:hypothetical protein